jgi:serine/threonine protein kinase
LEEIRLLKSLAGKSDYVTRYHDSFKTTNHYYLVIEYCRGTDLKSLLNHGLTLSEKALRYIYRQVLLGMRELDRELIVHRDLKNANILLDSVVFDSSRD